MIVAKRPRMGCLRGLVSLSFPPGAGDVGCGKTIVAFLAMLTLAASGWQVPGPPFAKLRPYALGSDMRAPSPSSRGGVDGPH